MKITDAYTKYRINKGLQEHQIRAAAVSKIICDTSREDLPTQHIVDGSLVHDMGNLIKSKMDSMQELFEPEGVEYWQQVKAEMVATYGPSEDAAAKAIVQEIRLSHESVRYFNAFGIEAIPRVYENGNLGEKIATYCDMRVGPFGIISLHERLDDIRDRYLAAGDVISDLARAINDRQGILEEIEAEIFATTTINADEVTDDTTKLVQQELWDWRLSVIN